MKLSEHLTSEAFVFSDTAIRNNINNELPAALVYPAQVFAYKLYEPLLAIIGPVHLNSGFRSLALNNILPNSSKTSQHMQANAVDVVPTTCGLIEAFKNLLLSETFFFDQLMLEGVNAAHPKGRWIHASYNSSKEDSEQRKQIKLVTFETGDPSYHTMTLEQALAWCDSHV